MRTAPRLHLPLRLTLRTVAAGVTALAVARGAAAQTPAEPPSGVPAASADTTASGATPAPPKRSRLGRFGRVVAGAGLTREGVAQRALGAAATRATAALAGPVPAATAVVSACPSGSALGSAASLAGGAGAIAQAVPQVRVLSAGLGMLRRAKRGHEDPPPAADAGLAAVAGGADALDAEARADYQRLLARAAAGDAAAAASFVRFHVQLDAAAGRLTGVAPERRAQARQAAARAALACAATGRECLTVP